MGSVDAIGGARKDVATRKRCAGSWRRRGRSPMILARPLRRGAELRHAEIMELDVERSLVRVERCLQHFEIFDFFFKTRFLFYQRSENYEKFFHEDERRFALCGKRLSAENNTR